MLTSRWLPCLTLMTSGCLDTAIDTTSLNQEVTPPLPVCFVNLPGSQCPQVGVIYLRENSLPLCEWGQTARSYKQFIHADWTCDTPEVPWPKPDNDNCNLGPTNDRPQNTNYWLIPRDQSINWTMNLVWPDRTGMYGDWVIACTRSDTAAFVDQVQYNLLDGIQIPGGNCSWPNPTSQSILAEVDGGTIVHIKPSLVRAQATIGYPYDSGGQLLTLTLAIQTHGTSGWQDYAISSRAVNAVPSPIELQATVPPGLDVRMQLRASTVCFARPSESYDLRNARIQVETCVPDQSMPGSCL